MKKRTVLFITKGGQTPTRRFFSRLLNETYRRVFGSADAVDVEGGYALLKKEHMLEKLNDPDTAMVVAIMEYVAPRTAYSTYAIAGTGLEEYRKILTEAGPEKTSWDCAMNLRSAQRTGKVSKFKV